MKKSRFEVVVRGDQRAFDALEEAGIAAMGPPYGEESGKQIVDYVLAVVKADTADAARERVEEKLPPGCAIEQVNPIDED